MISYFEWHSCVYIFESFYNLLKQFQVIMFIKIQKFKMYNENHHL